MSLLICSVYARQSFRANFSDLPSSHAKTTKNISSLNPYFVTGFTDAEGCFSVNIWRDSQSKTGWKVKAIFSIGLNIKDRAVLELIKSHFKAGGIYKHGKDTEQYRVTSLQDLVNIIIPHFDKYSLLTQKRADFELFKQIVYLMDSDEHLTLSGLQKIVNLRASINLGLSPLLKTAFPGTILIKRPLIPDQKIMDPNWIAGFVSGW